MWFQGESVDAETEVDIDMSSYWKRIGDRLAGDGGRICAAQPNGPGCQLLAPLAGLTSRQSPLTAPKSFKYALKAAFWSLVCRPRQSPIDVGLP